MIFADRAPIEKVRRLADGRIAAVAKFARSGIYQYTGAEVGRPDLATVRVYRDEAEVFSEDAMASFAHKAITLDHPGEPVSSKNWRKVAVGYTEGRVARDGAFVEIPLILADAEAVSTFDRGAARELSAGYSCTLDWTPGKTPQGEAFDARQLGIRGNHIALVPAGRAGSECRIGDHAPGGAYTMDMGRALAAARYHVDGTKLVEMPEGSTRGVGGTTSAYSASTQDATPSRASIDAIRAARYQG